MLVRVSVLMVQEMLVLLMRDSFYPPATYPTGLVLHTVKPTLVTTMVLVLMLAGLVISRPLLRPPPSLCVLFPVRSASDSSMPPPSFPPLADPCRVIARHVTHPRFPLRQVVSTSSHHRLVRVVNM